MRVRPAQVLSWQTWLAAWAPLASAALLLGVMVCLLPNVDGVAQLPRRNIALPSSLLHAYFGTCLALAVMNLTLWTWLKDKLYLHCAAFLGVGVLYVQLRVWPDDQVVGHTTAGQLLGTAWCNGHGDIACCCTWRRDRPSGPAMPPCCALRCPTWWTTH